MNNETTYTNRIKRKMVQKLAGVGIYKHSDRFKKGVSDFHFTLPGGFSAWVEVKYMKACSRRRKAGVTEPQWEYLKAHWKNHNHGFVLVGAGKQSAVYHIQDFDGYVYAEDLVDDKQAIMHMVNFLHKQIGVNMQLSQFQFNEIKNALTSGLCYDGGHHKQYYLERALHHLVGEDEFAYMKDMEEWDDGIPA